ncbi:uncharacterized protein LOC132932887 [Metopolophium dirhodum]|nr:uncharacterized protein LOC132932546 [Metopolophium dirhodum]XP_060855000.1 uncharacterized protein LOC132932641 [Metopolophium dirhodum]XP_060855103.1 uncharacterized protein LOC132932755 [Metopolophium dirhodum]XP_060855119.1 uncharacterized protein LOC132932771 [Metopolophium dirhodum]XP_060855218.1 uncharacterized protein LOC132932887 [Metopolophium dirhodum]
MNYIKINFNAAVQTLNMSTAAPAPPAETAVAARHRHQPPRKAPPKRRCYRCNKMGHTVRQCLAPQTPRRAPATQRGGLSSVRVRPPRSLSARSTRTQTPGPQPIGISTPMASTVSNIFNPNSAK